MGPFDRAPFIVIWETTRACALACVHCRAEALPRRDPRELTTDEGRALMDRVAAFGDPSPLLVLTGGDPLCRPDIVELVAYGTRRGLSVSLTPSGTAAVTEARLRALRDAGLARLAVSLDGATAEAHDAFRGVVGSHRHTLAIVERARGLGLPLQINTTVCRAGNVRHDDLAAVYRASALFTALRDPAQLGGRCGRCEYRDACGGSRARAFAVAEDPLAEDPGCAWEPAERAVAAIAGGSDAAPAVSEQAVLQALGTVLDPELGMSIVDLGLVYDVHIRNGAVGITMTLTAPGCPIHDVMPDWVRTAAMRVPGVETVEVTLTFEPPWTPDRIRTSWAAER